MPDAPIIRLRRILGALRVQRPLAPEDATWLAKGIGDYLAGAGHGVTVDRALGVAPLAGSTPWWEVEARAARDTKLRELYQRNFVGMSMNAAAQEIARLARRRRVPGGGDAQRLLDEALATGLPAPSARTVRRILVGHDLGLFMANDAAEDAAER